MYFAYVMVAVCIASIILMIVSNSDWPAIMFIASIFLFIISLSMGIVQVVDRCCEYPAFEQKIELQRAYYETINQGESNVTAIIDIMETNEELFRRQASYLRYGDWSSTPASVMDIKPIGGK